MTDPVISIVLPVCDEVGALTDAVSGYVEKLQGLRRAWEILLVPESRDGSQASYAQTMSISPAIRLCRAASGWGAAVRTGLDASSGDVLCYTNWRRTSAALKRV